MDTTNSSNVTDDQELAKVLEGMNQTVPASPVDEAPAVAQTVDDSATADGMSFEATPAPSVTPSIVTSAHGSVLGSEPTSAATPTPSLSPELDSLKKAALSELRPLVDKLNLPADEKFDTLLLLIRSTDDKSLLSAAHDAAKEISDETKRAQALLDIIKEIDYFSGHGAQPT